MAENSEKRFRSIFKYAWWYLTWQQLMFLMLCKLITAVVGVEDAAAACGFTWSCTFLLWFLILLFIWTADFLQKHEEKLLVEEQTHWFLKKLRSSLILAKTTQPSLIRRQVKYSLTVILHFGFLFPQLQISRLNSIYLTIISSRLTQFLVPGHSKAVLWIILFDLTCVYLLGNSPLIYDYINGHGCNRIDYSLENFWRTSTIFDLYAVLSFAWFTNNKPEIPEAYTFTIPKMYRIETFRNLSFPAFRSVIRRFSKNYIDYALNSNLYNVDFERTQLFFFDSVLIGCYVPVLMIICPLAYETFSVYDAFILSIIVYGYLDRVFLFGKRLFELETEFVFAPLFTEFERKLFKQSNSFVTLGVLCFAFVINENFDEKLPVCLALQIVYIVARLQHLLAGSLVTLLALPLDFMISCFLSMTKIRDFFSFLTVSSDLNYFLTIVLCGVLLSRFALIELVLIGHIIQIITDKKSTFAIYVRSSNCRFVIERHEFVDLEAAVLRKSLMTVVVQFDDLSTYHCLTRLRLKEYSSDRIVLYFSDWFALHTFNENLMDAITDFLNQFKIFVVASDNSTGFRSMSEIERTARNRTLLSLFAEDEFVLIICSNSTPLMVKRQILIRSSEVLAAMLRHYTREKQTQCIHINDVDVDTMRELVRFISLGTIHHLDLLAVRLLIAADMYAIDSLKRACETFLCGTINRSNYVNILPFADLYNADQLKRCVVEFIKREF